MGLIMLTLLEIAALPTMLALLLAMETLTTAFAMLCPSILPYVSAWRSSVTARQRGARSQRDGVGRSATIAASTEAGAEPRRAEAIQSRGAARLRRFGKVGGLCVLVTLAAAVIADTIFFESLVRATLARLMGSTGLRFVSYRVDGSFLRGRFAFADLCVTRGDSDAPELQLRFERLEIRLNMLALALGRIAISSLHAAGVDGRLAHIQREDERRPRGNIVIERVRLSDVRIRVDVVSAGRAPQTWPITMSLLEGGPIRRRWAAVDVLINCAGAGTVAECPFAIERADPRDQRVTRWTLETLPVEFAASLVGGPLHCCSSGTVSAAFCFREMEDSVECEVQLSAIGLQCGTDTAPDAGPAGRAACMLMGRLSRQDRPLNAQYAVRVPRASADGALSIRELGLRQRLDAAFGDVIGRLAVTDASRIHELVEEKKSRIRDGVGRARQQLRQDAEQRR